MTENLKKITFVTSKPTSLNISEDSKNHINKKLFSVKKKTSYIPKKKPKKTIRFFCKKVLRFHIKDFIDKNEERREKKRKKNLWKINFVKNKGRWSKSEHEQFLNGISEFGNDWRNVKSLIKNRTPAQVRSHAQKFFKKIKDCKDEELGFDFTSNNNCTIKDMINKMKSLNNNTSIKNILIHLSNKYDERKNYAKNLKKIFVIKYTRKKRKKPKENNELNIII